MLGGHLVDTHGLPLHALITAGLQLCSAAILSSLARVVERESSSTYARVETSEGETKEERATTKEEGGAPAGLIFVLQSSAVDAFGLGINRLTTRSAPRGSNQ